GEQEVRRESELPPRLIDFSSVPKAHQEEVCCRSVVSLSHESVPPWAALTSSGNMRQARVQRPAGSSRILPKQRLLTSRERAYQGRSVQLLDGRPRGQSVDDRHAGSSQLNLAAPL